MSDAITKIQSQVLRDTEILNFLAARTEGTGSATFGLGDVKDHDRFCDSATLQQLIALLDDHGVKRTTTQRKTSSGGEDVSDRVQFTVGGVDFDVFSLADKAIPVFRATTEMVAIAARHDPIAARNKPLRIQLFRQIRNTLLMWQDLHEVPL